MNNNETATHTLTCDGPKILPGVRMERPWSCSCGQTFYGYDTHVRREFKAHKAAATT